MSVLGGVAVLYLAALAIGRWVPLAEGLRAYVAVGALAVAVVVYFVRLRPLLATPCLALALVAAGVGAAPRDAASVVALPGGEARLRGVVESARLSPPSFVVRLSAGTRLEDGAAWPAGVRIRIADGVSFPGARVSLVAHVVPFARFRNPTPHPELFDAPAVDARGRLLPHTRVEVLASPPLLAFLAAARQRVRDALHATLEPRADGLAEALVLGDGDAVDDASDAAVRGAGLAHVLAVSGLHVVILVGLVVALLRRALLHVPWLARRVDVRRVASALGVPLALVYAAFAGGAPSAWRSAIAAAIGWTLVALGRRPRAGRVAAAAAVVLAAVSPEDVLRPAFLLSVVAAAALVTTSRAHGDGGARLRTLVAESMRTTLATAPLILWCFAGVPVLGVAANVLLAPVGSYLLLPLASLHAVVATVARPLAPLTGVAFELVADAFVAGAATFAQTGLGLRLPPPSVAEGVVVAALCFVLLAARSWRHRLLLAAAAAVALAGAEWQLRETERPHGVLRTTFLDVGQGDATLVDLPDGRLMLVDAGGAPHGGVDPGRHAIVPLLRARRRDAIDVVVLTHPHPDHYGGLRAVLASVRVRELWDSGQADCEDPTGTVATMLRDARRRGIVVRGPPELCGRSRQFGTARVDVLAPCPRWDPGYDANDNSLVLRIAIGRRALLLVGDAESHEEHVLASPAIHADVLKVGHHGSRTSSTDAFLASVRPRIALVSDGVGNPFGHPHAEALTRLARAGARVVRIDEHGGVTVTTDGTALAVHTYDGYESGDER